MLTRALFIFCLIVAPLAALAEMAKGDAITSLEAGIICPPEPFDAAPAPDTLAGQTHVITEDPPFVSNSQVVPAALGVGFGIKALSDAPGGLPGVIVRVSHPPMGENGRQTQSFITAISGQSPSVTFYQFDHTYELVQGTWTIAAYAGELELYAVTFEVVDPRLVPELAGACNFAELLS